MSGYAQIRGGLLWYQLDVERLSDEAFRLLMYCFSGPGRTMVGVRRYNHSDPLSRLPDWTEEMATRALYELIDANLVTHDPKARVLYLRMQFEHAPLRGVKPLQGAAKAMADLPLSPVLEEPLRYLEGAALEALNKPTSEATQRDLTVCLQNFRALLAQICQDEPSPDTLSMPYQGENSPTTRCGKPGEANHKIDRVSGFAKFALQDQEQNPEQEQDSPPTPPFPQTPGKSGGLL